MTCYSCGQKMGRSAWRAWIKGRGWVDVCTGCFWEKAPGNGRGVRGPQLPGEERC